MPNHFKILKKRFMLNNFLFDDTKIAQHKIDVKMRMNEMLIWKDDMTTRKHKS